ncbi:putative glutamate--tRNA ligase, mitochondrial [Nymphon striatum]|nr:putative glutamate--tRNA ligase, mitochondrial [Nymphon striatum]
MMKLSRFKFTRILCRFMSDKVRVRFAPSPTGNMHLGGLRMALYNYLFTYKNNGQFILRIEDTDKFLKIVRLKSASFFVIDLLRLFLKSRSISSATENILEMLDWAGITPDESPTKGGCYGPYIQSERSEIYQQMVQKLLKAGSAYHCFCSEQRLSELKEECKKNCAISKYDGKCRSLSTKEIEDKLISNDKYTIRFKVQSKKTHLHDMVYGTTVKNVAEQDGDPIVIKSDGSPTYHFASVVDDHLMKITHVLRGNEWLSSTPKHIEIYEAFGWIPPKFGHLPLLLHPSGRKFSKREKDSQVNSFKVMLGENCGKIYVHLVVTGNVIIDRGYFPEALLNFITSSSSGFVDHDTRFPYSLPELAKKFHLEMIMTNSCKLDFKKLQKLNQLWIQKKIASENSLKELIESVHKLIASNFPNSISKESDEYISKVLKLLENRIVRINEVVSNEYDFFWKLPQVENSEFFKICKDAEDEWSEELEAMHSKGEELQQKMPAYRSVVVGSVVQLKEQSLVDNFVRKWTTKSTIWISDRGGRKRGKPKRKWVDDI